jgi:hypothetical protein
MNAKGRLNMEEILIHWMLNPESEIKGIVRWWEDDKLLF